MTAAHYLFGLTVVNLAVALLNLHLARRNAKHARALA